MSDIVVGKVDLGKCGAMPAFPPPPPPRESKRIERIDLNLMHEEEVVSTTILNGYVIVVTNRGRVYKVCV